MYTMIGSKKYKVKKTGNRYYYWSPLAIRWLPVAAVKVEYE